MKDKNYKKYKEFLDLFDKKKKGEALSIAEFHRETGFAKDTIRKFMERLDSEGKVEVCVENRRLKKIVKL